MKFKISWVKANVDIQRNENADIFVKHVTLDSYGHIEKPMTTLKIILKELIIKQWQFVWN